MNRKEQNIAVFEDTMDWIGHEPALSAAVKKQHHTYRPLSGAADA